MAGRGGVTVATKPGTGNAGGALLVTGSGPSDAVSRLRAYNATAVLAAPNGPATTFDIEPIDGDASGIYME